MGVQTSQPTADAESQAPASPQKGPFWRDLEDLRAIASPRIVKRGVNYFKEHRVFDIDWDERSLRAQVEGSDPRRPYTVQLAVDDQGELETNCDCPYDWEPNCKHIIATLLAYGARQPLTEQDVSSASDEALEARRRRGQTEVVVEHVSGEPSFGTWSAHSVDPSGGIPRGYRVQIRSLTERINRCSCDDFATNQLGTCKHIEAVLHRLKRHKQQAAEPRLAVPVVYLDWNTRNAPQVRVRRPDAAPVELTDCLDRHFDDTGFLKGDDEEDEDEETGREERPPPAGAPRAAARRALAEHDPDEGQDIGGAKVRALPDDTEVERSDAVEAIRSLQDRLGSNLERVVVTRAGLMAVVDRTNHATSRLSATISDRLPVAIVDGRTYGALRQLGLGLPTDSAHAIWSRAARRLSSRRRRLANIARKGLGGAWHRLRRPHWNDRRPPAARA